MKKWWKKIGLALAIMTASSQAWSLVLLEPYLGYQFSLDGEASSEGESEDFSFSGFGAGGRLGVNLSRFMFGLSYDWMWFDIKFDSGGEKIETDQNNFGIFFGGNDKGSKFRYWVEYFIDVKNKNKVDVEGVSVEAENSGNGWGLGFGYRFTDILAANIEYRNWSLDKMDVAGIDVPGVTFKGQSIFITISAPFDLGSK